MDYAQAVTYLYDRLPVFHRVGAKALKPGLANTLALCAGLGNPHQKFRSIHVAGTNGKGSTSHMLASIYQAAGYTVGLYTSPHLKSFTERIRINGEPIADSAVAAFVTKHQSLIESIEPSFFEVTVVMAFDHFARQGVDLAIIEVGLGGRLDSTNVITPLLSVITNIGYDHMDILGSTLPAIAAEKAGIIKPGVPVTISETQPETQAVFVEKAADCQSVITFADRLYTIQDAGIRQGRREVLVQDLNLSPGHTPHSPKPGSDTGITLSLDLVGGYQLRNMPGVLGAIDALHPIFPVDRDALARGLASVARTTGLKGRFQVMQEHPRVVADTAHNLPGMDALLTTIAALSYRSLHFILGFVNDKDVSAVLQRFPKQATYSFSQSHTPRSMPADALAQLAAEKGLPVVEGINSVFPDVNAALADALSRSQPDDLIVVTGSTYLVAELINL